MSTKRLLRVNKFSPKLLFVYLFGLVLIGLARPPESLVEPAFLTGVVLMVLGEVVRVWAAGHLRKNEELTTSGPYSFVKNPLYIGTILITVGTCILVNEQNTGYVLLDHYNWIMLGLAIAIFLFYYIPYKKKREGNRLHEKFGEAWEEYDRQVPDYIPRLTPYRNVGTSEKSWSGSTFIENSEHWTGLVILALILIVTFKHDIMNLIGL